MTGDAPPNTTERVGLLGGDLRVQPVAEGHASRDQYLDRAVTAMSPMLTDLGYMLPRVRCSTSCTSSGRRSTATSETYPPNASRGSWAEIQVVPELETPLLVVVQLLACLITQAAGFSRGQGKRCKAIAAELGLAWSARNPVPGEELAARLNAVVADLGEYPHSMLDVNYGRLKRQSTRLLVARCGQCAYKVYITRKHAVTGVPSCATHPELGPLTLAVPLEGEETPVEAYGAEQPEAVVGDGHVHAVLDGDGEHAGNSHPADPEADVEPSPDITMPAVAATMADRTAALAATQEPLVIGNQEADTPAAARGSANLDQPTVPERGRRGRKDPHAVSEVSSRPARKSKPKRHDEPNEAVNLVLPFTPVSDTAAGQDQSHEISAASSTVDGGS